MPRTKGKQPRQRSTDRTSTVQLKLPKAKLEYAYRALGIDAKAVDASPQITPILRKLPGGLKTAIEYLRGADSPEARTWLDIYDDLPITAQRLVPFEAVCVKADITTRRMMEIITGACFEQSDIAAKLLATAAHPAVVQATIKSATKGDAKGVKDREMLHKHQNFLPVPGKAMFIAPGGIGQQNNQLNAGSVDIGNKVSFQVAEIQNIEKAQARIANRYNESLGMGEGHQAPSTAQVEHRQLAHTQSGSVEPELVEDAVEDAVEDEEVPTWSQAL